MNAPLKDQEFLDALQAFLGPEATVWGSTKDELQLAESQHNWALRIAGLAVLLGLGVGYFSPLIGAVLALVCLVIAAALNIDGWCVRIALNQRAMLKVQAEVLVELRKLNSRQ